MNDDQKVKIFAMVSDQGTACGETALCNVCHANSENRIAVVKRAGADVVIAKGFLDCSENEALACCACSFALFESPEGCISGFLRDLNSLQ